MQNDTEIFWDEGVLIAKRLVNAIKLLFLSGVHCWLELV
jgi:hypothetical protein